MTPLTSAARPDFSLRPGRSLASLLLLLLLSSALSAQTTVTDGYTPLALSPGSPTGSYGLSGFESVNLFNGNLNFALPLLGIGGRGGASHQITRGIEHKWVVERFHDDFGDYYSYFPGDSWEQSNDPGYGAGLLKSRYAAVGDHICHRSNGLTEHVYLKTLTRLTFTVPGGTEFELRDQQTGGQPYILPTCAASGYSRGRVFVTADGTSATFISDTDIVDAWKAGDASWMGEIYMPSGYLMLRDGTRYRIDEGVVTWLRDRNGNRLSFTYSVGSSGGRLTTITDSLNRQVNIIYNSTSAAYDEIKFKGFGGAERTIRVNYSSLDTSLRAGYALQTYKQLFPELDGSSTTNYDPMVISSISLPDGRSYTFSYDSYGELARVVLPTGGAIEYDYAAGFSNGNASGAVNFGSVLGGAFDWEVYRRVIERRTYSNGVTLESKMTYSRPETGVGSSLGYVVVDQKDAAGALLGRQKHYFFGSAGDSLNNTSMNQPISYPVWKEGREYKSEMLGSDGSTVLNRVESTFEQRAAVSWWPGMADGAPSNDTRLTQTVTTLADTNQVSQQNFFYDQFNNQTDVYDYDYGAGAPGSLVRRTHIDYLTSNPVNGIDYTSTNVHIRSLPTQQQVFDAAGVERARATYEYDNYAADTYHSPLVARSLISGLDSSFNTSYQTRGNATGVSKWLLPAGTAISSYAQYDIAGNTVKAIDGRGYQMTFDFSDRYGAPDGDARANSSPVELGTQSSFAFPTSITNALGQTGYMQHDYYTGAAVNGEDANGVVSSGYYDDVLDRPTQMIRAVNQPSVKSQTTFTYDDVNRTVTSTGDLNSFGDNQLKSAVVFDGFGRNIETRSYEGVLYISTRRTFDALGRVSQSSNPFRPTQESPLWTTTQFDALGRVITVTAPDAAQVVTTYSGNQVTVQDQAGKQRRSVTDALGRLTQVIEAPNSASFNYQTDYAYDALGNLRTVVQGQQTRSYSYDSLSRLISAANPESGTVSYQYDANGNLTQKVDARNVTTSYSYDALNRAVSRAYSDSTPTVTYLYDTLTNGKGRLTSVSSSVSVYSYSGYDAIGKVTGSSQSIDGQTYSMTYGYNLAGALTTETYPSGRVVTTSYDNSGRLSQITGQKTGEANKTYASQISYAASGAITDLKLGNNLWEHVSFNGRLQPTEIGLGTTQGGTDRLKLNYAYGTTANNGNVQSQTITIPGGPTLSQSYTYDSLNRLKSAEEMSGSSQSWKQTFVYDRYGNRTFDAANTSSGMVSSLLTIDQSTNRFTTGQGSILYDNVGNLTRDFNAHTFSYDAENHQVAYDGGATSNGTDYKYDGDGRRVKKVTGTNQQATIFIYDAQGQMVAEYSTLSQQGSGGTSYLTMDNLGTPRIISDSSGGVKARHDYLPFGEEVAVGTGGRTTQQGYVVDNVRQKFTQKERDVETGLDYFNARYYSSAQGRFSSPDGLLSSGRPENPQTWNRFSYVLNNPLGYIDPTGFFEYSNGTDKEHERFEAQLQRARDQLDQIKARYGADSVEYNDAARSINAYGDPGEKNGVIVTFGKTSEGTPGESGGLFGADGTKSINVTIDMSKNKTDNRLLGTVVHEGSHVQDRADLVDGILKAGSESEASSVVARFNATRETTETRAYSVESVFAEFTYKNEQPPESGGGTTRFGLGTYTQEYAVIGKTNIWNPSWAGADVAKVRASRSKAISKGLHETYSQEQLNQQFMKLK
jgi:RHS repeat-associated protein